MGVLLHFSEEQTRARIVLFREEEMTSCEDSAGKPCRMGHDACVWGRSLGTCHSLQLVVSDGSLCQEETKDVIDRDGRRGLEYINACYLPT